MPDPVQQPRSAYPASGHGVTGPRKANLPTLSLMQPTLRVDSAGVQAMATRWNAAVGELTGTAAPAGLGLSCQVSAAAVNAAHGDVAAFAAGLATRVGTRVNGVTEAAAGYVANEAESATEVAAVVPSVTSV